MIRISQLKVPAEWPDQKGALRAAAAAAIHSSEDKIQTLSILRQSLDARRKPDIFYSYTVDVTVAQEEKLVKRARSRDVILAKPCEYHFPDPGVVKLPHRPVIVGTGPAGLFCGYYLARAGYCPILLERGEDVDTRQRDVERFWQEGILKENSNVQFGEGGAGTFSDGKLNTLVKDREGRNREVLKTFVRFGADEEILYQSKPHLGTDVLRDVVKRMREEICRLGGEVHFGSQVTDLLLSRGRLQGVIINEKEELRCELAALAVGHSARDTFHKLYTKGLSMEARPFAVGLRVEHPQAMIDLAQYGRERTAALGPAIYKVTARTSLNRGVYSFCMCPGGFVVNASSEAEHLAVNGMSYSARDGVNANSAVIVAVTPEDYGTEHPLGGIAFQRELERQAYALGQGKIPVQRYGDFQEKVCGSAEARFRKSGASGKYFPVLPRNKGGCTYADVSRILPRECNLAFVEGMTVFGRQIPGFDREDAILSGVESRTSSPVRILRGDNLQSPEASGLYPCGEGAGYAGGITSAAMDGLRVAEQIVAGYARPVG